MGMSKKAKALLTGEKTSEWNEYQIDMQDAYNEFMADQAKAERGQKSKSGWSKLAGAVVFGLAIMATGGVAGIAAGGWGAAGQLALGTALGAGAAWGAHEAQGDVLLGGGKTKEDYLAGIHDPKFGKGQAEIEKSRFGADIQTDITALESYESGGLESALFENVGRSSSYLPQAGPLFKSKG